MSHASYVLSGYAISLGATRRTSTVFAVTIASSTPFRIERTGVRGPQLFRERCRAWGDEVCVSRVRW